MEFTTEVYLNDLLTNTEVNGFESAKESFYECINTNDDIAMEGADESTDNTSNTVSNDEKKGFGGKLIELILKVLKFAWDIFTYIPKWMLKKINELTEKYKLLNNATDALNSIPNETRQAAVNYINATADSFGATSKAITADYKSYLKNLTQIIAKGVNITNDDISNGTKLAEEATSKINESTKICTDTLASLNDAKSKIVVPDSSNLSVAIIIEHILVVNRQTARINYFKACKTYCNDGAAIAKDLITSVEKLSNASNSENLKSFLPKVTSASKAYLNMAKAWQQLVTQHYTVSFGGIVKVLDKDTKEFKSYKVAT